MRQFDIRYSYFTKIVLPAVGLLIGLLGAYTGYLAVKQKQSDQKNAPVYQALPTNYFQPGRDE